MTSKRHAGPMMLATTLPSPAPSSPSHAVAGTREQDYAPLLDDGGRLIAPQPHYWCVRPLRCPCAAHSKWDRAAVAGTAFAPAVRGNSSLWQSESSRSFQPKDYLSTIQSSSGGMRSEQARRALHRALHRALRGAQRSRPTPMPTPPPRFLHLSCLLHLTLLILDPS